MTKNQYGFLALALRQRFIRRWSTMGCSQTENVLEHSAVVTLLTMLVGRLAISNGRDIDLTVMLEHAILHDVSEVLCSDVITPVKRATPQLYAEFQKLEKVAETRLISTLPSVLQDCVENALNIDGLEHQLVKACDTYSAYIKCRIEVNSGNGIEFNDALAKMEQEVLVLREIPEINQIHRWFEGGLSESVDSLLN